MTGARRLPWRPIAVAGLVVFMVAGAGGALTEIGPWYRALRKPALQPPDWLFGPAWTVIFAATAAACVDAWLRDGTRRRRTILLVVVAINAVLNVAWSALFFAARRPDWALAEVGFLWLSIVLMMAAAGAMSRRAAGWLLPYLLWVAFAATLNAGVVALNSPFAA